MKSIITGILLFILCLLSFQDLTQVALFKINQDFIITNFCINKADKVYTCNGKCHLSKAIAQSKDNKSSNNPSKTLDNKRVNLIYLIGNQPIDLPIISFIKLNSIFFHKELLSSSHLSDLLRPPIV